MAYGLNALVIAGMLTPFVITVRRESRLAQRQHQLRTLAMALEEFEQGQQLPPAALYDKAGRPLLSWRVALLPALGERALYDQFKLDQPWDSPHNRRSRRECPAYSPPATRPRVGRPTSRSIASSSRHAECGTRPAHTPPLSRATCTA